MRIKLHRSSLAVAGPASLLLVSIAGAQSASLQDPRSVVAAADLPSLFFPSLSPATLPHGPGEAPNSTAAFIGPSETAAVAMARPRDITVEPGIRATRPFKSLGVGFTAGLSGLGIDLATPIADRYNLRIGASFLGFSATFHEQGVPVQGTIHMASGRVVVDYAPKGKSFHISPGIAFYNRDHYRATAFVPTGTIKFNGESYTSDPNDPIRGEAIVPLANRPAPRITVGWGNMIRHRTPPNFTFPVEIGVEYINAPTLTLKFTGSTCNTNGRDCTPIATNLGTQANIAQDEQEITSELRPLRFFPIFSFGVSYKFGH